MIPGPLSGIGVTIQGDLSWKLFPPLRLTAESITAVGEATEVVTVFRRDGLETDLAVHINHVDTSGTGRQSALGQRLASELKNHGLVAHTVWQEL